MIQIITDSTCDLPPEIVARYGIKIIPLQLIFGDETLRDGVDISYEEFFRRLRLANPLPTTSQPPVGVFKAAFEESLREGREVLGIFISSRLSGTFATAEAAKELLPGEPITLVDSLSTSLGMGLQVIAAARAVERGASREEAAALVVRLREKVRVYFTLDTLDYLHRGGRIGGAQAFLGTLLNVKPLLILRDGRVEAYERVRTKRKALERMLEAVLSEVGPEPAFVGVLHGEAEAEAKMLAEQAQARARCREMLTSTITPVLAAHTGPGVVGIAACPNDIL